VAAHGLDTRDTVERCRDCLKAAIAAFGAFIVVLDAQPRSNSVNAELKGGDRRRQLGPLVYLARAPGASVDLRQQPRLDASVRGA
jgi:hypothetical protein